MSVLPTPSPGSPPANLEDYRYISQQGTDQVGVNILVAGVPTDPDANTVVVSMVPDIQDAQPIFTGRSAVRQFTGVYAYNFLSTDTAITGHYHLAWTYQISKQPDTFLTPIEIGTFNPAYDNLPVEMKNIVELVWAKFADGVDSQFGGPNIQSYFQSHFSRGRVAQLLQIVLMQINTSMQPVNNFSATGPGGSQGPSTGPQFPYQQWGGVLVAGLSIEVIKHLMRSYVEEPQGEGTNSARMTRRDYVDRWSQILQTEQEEYQDMLEVMKIRQMFRLQPKVLVSGGVYGNYGPTRLAGQAAARGLYWNRMM